MNTREHKLCRLLMQELPGINDEVKLVHLSDLINLSDEEKKLILQSKLPRYRNCLCPDHKVQPNEYGRCTVEECLYVYGRRGWRRLGEYDS